MLAKIKYWEKYCGGINHQTKLKHVWTKIRELKNVNSNNSNIIVKNIHGKLIEDQLLADNFANTFKAVTSTLDVEIDHNKFRSQVVADYCNKLCHYKTALSEAALNDSQAINEKFTLIELEEVIKEINTRSSPGSDGIAYILFRHSPPNMLRLILYIINLSWEQNDIPPSWKHAIVKPILKPGKDKNDTNSYRPIALTNTISKLAEKLIVKRLSWYLEKNQLLNPSQSGFRRNRSTCDPIIRLHHEAEFSVRSGFVTVGVLIDFSKAFDLLWVDGLLLKMMSLNITGKLLNWTKKKLSNRTYQVKVGGALSYEYSTLNGTPQGSSYSPLLFLIMVNDFPKLSLYTSEGFFADDCTIWRSGINIETVLHHLQIDLNKISEWCKKWGFIINTNKTTGIVFTNRKIDRSNINLKINGEHVKFEKTCKLLGVTMDSHLTWVPHINHLVEKSSKGLNIMRCLSGTGWGSSKRVLLTLHKSLILSSLDYCSFVYANASATI